MHRCAVWGVGQELRSAPWFVEVVCAPNSHHTLKYSAGVGIVIWGYPP